MYLYPQTLHDARALAPPLAGWHGLGKPPPSAKQIYTSQTQVRELTDRGFQNIFYDRGKLIVVSFWADSCRACDAVASTVVSVAQKIAQGPHARLVKFYHAQWDPAVNPRLYQQYGFKGIPVVFFYYMSTGKQPTKAASLLEASTRGDRFDTDPAAYLRNIEDILRRHGHIAPGKAAAPNKAVAPNKTIAQARGWSRAQDLIDSGAFKHVDGMLVWPSTVSQYFAPLYRTLPNLRLSRMAKVLDRSSFNLQYQRIHGQLPDAKTLGVVDPNTNQVFMVAMNIHLHVYLNSAVHEAVHLFACRRQGRTGFFDHYGAALTEGFTQFVTEEILRAQKVTLNSTAYRGELAIAAKLVQKLTLAPVAEDYFRCTRNVQTRLHAAGIWGRFLPLNIAANNATRDSDREQKYREISQLLDTLP